MAEKKLIKKGEASNEAQLLNVPAELLGIYTSSEVKKEIQLCTYMSTVPSYSVIAHQFQRRKLFFCSLQRSLMVTNLSISLR